MSVSWRCFLADVFCSVSIPHRFVIAWFELKGCESEARLSLSQKAHRSDSSKVSCILVVFGFNVGVLKSHPFCLVEATNNSLNMVATHPSLHGHEVVDVVEDTLKQAKFRFINHAIFSTKHSHL